MSNAKVTEATILLAQEAVHTARTCFQVELDFSETSLQRVDTILGKIHVLQSHRWRAQRLQRSTTADLNSIAVIWGSYVGEVLRQRWGGEWVSTLQAEPTLPALAIRLPVGGGEWIEFLPASRIYRIITGAETETLWSLSQRFKHLQPCRHPGLATVIIKST
jgi:hypothetical protein